MPIDALSLKILNVLGSHVGYIVSIELFIVFSELVASTILYSYLFYVLYICVFPLLEGKQKFKFGGVLSILKTDFIPMFCLGFSSFIR